MKITLNRIYGFSIIEMLVGLAIGLIIVAAATAMMVTTLKSQKEITASAKLNQELGTAIAVISNEIRRAGHTGNPVNELLFEPETDINVVKVDDEPTCILYSYDRDGNDADGDGNFIEATERNGFKIEDEELKARIACDDVSCPSDCSVGTWVTFSDKNIISIIDEDSVNDSYFSTTGSKCRNMKTGGESWAVGKVEDVVLADGTAVKIIGENTTPDTDFACEITDDDTYQVANYDDTGVPTDTVFDSDWLPKASEKGILFGNRNITIKLLAQLSNDPTVTKSMVTSVKVANPQIIFVE